ncbi:MAG TPA: ferredoxin reductase, partial [Phenylobacterium sp.]|nr:ferredoxin reductase [Phenylobacterium sp.]
MAPIAGDQLPAFSAGAHIDVEVAPGLVRQYSLCNNPMDRERYEIGVLLDPASRGGSIALHQAPEGGELRISAPRNHFELEARAERTILLAGGIGVTPILCMAERLSAIGADFTMHYATRSRARCAFFDRISRSPLAERVHFHFDDGPSDQQLQLA